MIGIAVGAAVFGAATIAFASSIGGVTTQSLTFWSGATSISPSSCSSGATQDTFIDASNRNTNYGTETYLNVIANGGKPAYALVEFTPCAPANAKILSATLRLYLSSSPGAGASYGVYPMTGSWPEVTSWNNSWKSVGGTQITSTTTGGSGSTLSWSLTSSVQAIVNGGSNYGWAIEDNGSVYEQGSINSREAGSNNPALVLSYYP